MEPCSGRFWILVVQMSQLEYGFEPFESQLYLPTSSVNLEDLIGCECTIKGSKDEDVVCGFQGLRPELALFPICFVALP